MKTLLLIFSKGLNDKLHLVTRLSNDYFVEFIVCERTDVSSILDKFEENYKNQTLEYLTLENISIKDILKFEKLPDSIRDEIHKYNENNFNENHDFIYIKGYIGDEKSIKRDFKELYQKFIRYHPIESIDYLKFDYRSEEDRIFELLESKFEEHISKIIDSKIDSKIDKLKTELLEVIESKFKEIETKINKYF